MAENWLADVRKYAPDADESVVDAIVRYCGISLRNRDSSLVSFADPAETARVRDNFLKKKLGLTDDNAVLDSGIAAVGERMKGDRTKNRVTVYYLLAEHFGLLNVFGGIAKVAPLAAGAAAGAAAAAAVPPLRAAAEPVHVADTTPRTAHSTYEEEEEKAAGGFGRWLPWLLLALLALAILYALNTCSNRADNTTTTAVPADQGTVTSEATGIPTPVAIPVGAAVIPSVREGHPMLTVFFETAKSEVHNDLSTAAAAVKDYIDAHPQATLAVSGYNDPTGNAAANAELSKNRAENVKAALERLGIPASRVVLEKPAEATGTGDTNAESRRVEVVVHD